MSVKKRFYYVNVLFWWHQQGGLHSKFEIPFSYKYLKDCEVFAEKLQDILREGNNETDHWFEPEVKIEEWEEKETAMRFNVQYMGFGKEDMAIEGKKIMKDRGFRTLQEAVEDSKQLLEENREIWQATIRDNELSGESMAFVHRPKKDSSRIIIEYEE